MAQALYTIHVPQHPNDVGAAVHHYLSTGPLKTNGITLNRGIHTTFDGQAYPHDLVSAYAEDSPESDSHIKQVGAWAGGATGVPVVYVGKQGKTPILWPVNSALDETSQFS